MVRHPIDTRRVARRIEAQLAETGHTQLEITEDPWALGYLLGAIRAELRHKQLSWQDVEQHTLDFFAALYPDEMHEKVAMHKKVAHGCLSLQGLPEFQSGVANGESDWTVFSEGCESLAGQLSAHMKSRGPVRHLQ